MRQALSQNETGGCQCTVVSYVLYVWMVACIQSRMLVSIVSIVYKLILVSIVSVMMIVHIV